MVTKFYWHDAATTDAGTFPSSAQTGTPTVTATGAATARAMDANIGSFQVSIGLTSSATKTQQYDWFRMFISRPLKGGTYATSGTWTVRAAIKTGNATNAAWKITVGTYIWRPSGGGSFVAAINTVLAGLGTAATTGETDTTAATLGGTDVTILDGDVLICEVWGELAQGKATAYTWTLFYDGTTEGSTTSNAAYIESPVDLPYFAPSARPKPILVYERHGALQVDPTIRPRTRSTRWGRTPRVGVTSKLPPGIRTRERTTPLPRGRSRRWGRVPRMGIASRRVPAIQRHERATPLPKGRAKVFGRSPRLQPSVVASPPQLRTIRRRERLTPTSKGRLKEFGRTPRAGETSRRVPRIQSRERTTPLPRGRSKPFGRSPRTQPPPSTPPQLRTYRKRERAIPTPPRTRTKVFPRIPFEGISFHVGSATAGKGSSTSEAGKGSSTSSGGKGSATAESAKGSASSTARKGKTTLTAEKD